MQNVLQDRRFVTLVSITLLLVALAVTACLWPAWQATRLNPVTALRYE